MKKRLIAAVAICLSILLCASGCRKTKKADNSSDSSSSDFLSTESEYSSDLSAISDTVGSGENANGSTAAGTTPVHQAGVVNDWDKDWAGTAYKSVDLGDVNLDCYPVDTNYDWGACILNINGVFKAWWTRGGPYDSIWYAQSSDLKNWTDVKMIFRVEKDSKWAKMHMADPSVVYVNGKYYFYMETNATKEGANTVTDSNIVMATSSDGINLKFYGGNNSPQSVLPPPTNTMNKGFYGTGQPSVIYKDGQFWMYYLDQTSATACTRLAKSKDGIHFSSNNNNTVVLDGGCGGVSYNSLLGKFMCIYTGDSNAFDKSKVKNGNVWICESSDGINWGNYKTLQTRYSNPTLVSGSAIKSRSFAGFVTNPQGIIDTPTFYVTWSEGQLNTEDGWWMKYFSTFDNHIAAVNSTKYAKRPIDLPNGQSANASTLAAYADTNIVWNSLNATAANGAATIDGNMDSLYNNSTEMTVSRLCTNYGSLPSKTYAKARAAWDSNYLYVWAQIYDSKVSTSYVSKPNEMYHRDSIAFYVNVPNDGTVEYDTRQYCICIGPKSGDFAVINPNSNLDLTREFTGYQYKAQQNRDGYVVEVKVPWHALIKGQISAGKTIGFDVSINDDLGRGDRDTIIGWSDYTGNAFKDLSVLGSLTLK